MREVENDKTILKEKYMMIKKNEQVATYISNKLPGS